MPEAPLFHHLVHPEVVIKHEEISAASVWGQRLLANPKLLKVACTFHLTVPHGQPSKELGTQIYEAEELADVLASGQTPDCPFESKPDSFPICAISPHMYTSLGWSHSFISLDVEKPAATETLQEIGFWLTSEEDFSVFFTGKSYHVILWRLAPNIKLPSEWSKLITNFSSQTKYHKGELDHIVARLLAAPLIHIGELETIKEIILSQYSHFDSPQNGSVSFLDLRYIAHSLGRLGKLLEGNINGCGSIRLTKCPEKGYEFSPILVLDRAGGKEVTIYNTTYHTFEGTIKTLFRIYK